MMLDWGVHLLDRLLFMIPDKVETVNCRLSYVLKEEVDDGFTMFLTFAGGLSALVEDVYKRQIPTQGRWDTGWLMRNWGYRWMKT